MKKLFLGVIVLLSTFTFAQDFSNTRFGVTGGLNYSRIRNAHNPSGPRLAFQGGGLALIPISSDDQFYLQPEVVYYSAGETGKDKDRKDDPGYDAVYADNYISVPVYFKAYFSENESEFFGMVGPRFNFLIGQNIQDPAKPHYTEEGVDYPSIGNVNGKASGFNFAMGFGLGYSYKRQLELVGKFDWGLSNIYKGLMNEPGSDPNIKLRKSQHVISLGINYIFE